MLAAALAAQELAPSDRVGEGCGMGTEHVDAARGGFGRPGKQAPLSEGPSERLHATAEASAVDSG